MSDSFYPTISIEFIETSLLKSPKIVPNSKIKIGDSTAFVTIGENKAMAKRLIILRELQPNEICYLQATALAARYGFMSGLLNWLEQNRNWKDGAYIVPKEIYK